MNEIDRLTVNDYQLYLLKSMDVPEPLLSQSLATLGCTAETMTEQAGKVSQAVRLGPGFAVNFKKILRPALIGTEAADQGNKYFYRLPLWPSFTYFALIIEDHEVVADTGFTRTPGDPQQPMLQPWKFLEEDMSRYFEKIKMIESWAPYVAYVVTGKGFEKPLELEFRWGLLREIEESSRAFDEIPAWQ